MSQEKIKVLLDKINLLANVFMKDGLEKVSQLEKDLLTEQVQELLRAVQELELKGGEGNQSNSSAPPPEENKPQEETPQPSSTLESVQEQEQEQAIETTPQEEEIEEEVIEQVEETTGSKESPVVQLEERSEEVREFSGNKPYRRIKEVIDLNKSFILKAELFNNDHHAYNMFIESLEALESEEDSFDLLDKKQKEMNWDIEDKAYQLLARAIEKRFLPLLHQ